MATLEAVQAKIRALQAQAEALIAKKTSTVLKAIHDLMSQHGLTTADIAKYSGQSKGGSKLSLKQAPKADLPAVKYRDPRTGKTWSGHGRAPLWIVDAKDRSKYLADGAVNASAPVVNNTSGTARKGPPKGPQPALYRDPQTGLTWSGRGPAPSWLASVKDRTSFLIEQNGESGGDTGGKSKVATKRAIVKKNAVASKTATAKTAATKTSGKSVANKVAVEKGAAKKATAKKATAKKTVSGKAATKGVSEKRSSAKSSAVANVATLPGPAVDAPDAAASQ